MDVSGEKHDKSDYCYDGPAAVPSAPHASTTPEGAPPSYESQPHYAQGSTPYPQPAPGEGPLPYPPPVPGAGPIPYPQSAPGAGPMPYPQYGAISTKDGSYPLPAGAIPYPQGGNYPPITPSAPLLIEPGYNHPSDADLPSYTCAMGWHLGDGQELIQDGDPVKRGPSCGNICCGIFSAIVHLGFIACFALLIWQLTVIGTDQYNEVTLILAGVFLGVSYLLHIIEICCSDTRKYVSNILQIHQAMEHVENMRRVLPSIVWHVECYHWETRYRTVTTRDANGNTSTRTESYQEKVVTHRESLPFMFTEVSDASGNFANLGFKQGTVTRVEFRKVYGFSDEHSKNSFDMQKSNFFARNRFRDTHMDTSETFEMTGFKQRVTVFVDQSSVKAWMSQKFYVLVSLIFCTWCYRWQFRKATNKKMFAYIKLFKVPETF